MLGSARGCCALALLLTIPRGECGDVVLVGDGSAVVFRSNTTGREVRLTADMLDNLLASVAEIERIKEFVSMRPPSFPPPPAVPCA